MIQVMLFQKKKEMWQLLLENMIEPTVPIIEPVVNGDPSEEGNNSRHVSQANTLGFRRNNPE